MPPKAAFREAVPELGTTTEVSMSGGTSSTASSSALSAAASTAPVEDRLSLVSLDEGLLMMNGPAPAHFESVASIHYQNMFEANTFEIFVSVPP